MRRARLRRMARAQAAPRLVRRDDALEQQLDLAAAGLAPSRRRDRNHARVVEHQHVARRRAARAARRTRDRRACAPSTCSRRLARARARAAARSARAAARSRNRKGGKVVARASAARPVAFEANGAFSAIMPSLARASARRTSSLAPPRLRASPAGMAELVDALDSKSSSGNRVGVRFPLPAPRVDVSDVRKAHRLKRSPFRRNVCQRRMENASWR